MSLQSAPSYERGLDAASLCSLGDTCRIALSNMDGGVLLAPVKMQITPSLRNSYLEVKLLWLLITLTEALRQSWEHTLRCLGEVKGLLPDPVFEKVETEIRRHMEFAQANPDSAQTAGAHRILCEAVYVLAESIIRALCIATNGFLHRCDAMKIGFESSFPWEMTAAAKAKMQSEAYRWPASPGMSQQAQLQM